MYGLDENKRQKALKKIQNQKFYLDNNFVNVSGTTFPLSAFFKNSFINSDRYIAELQNRVWSLFNYAKNRDLQNIFITLTLPSEYHPFTTTSKGKKRKNPNYIDDEAHNPKNATKKLSDMFAKIRHLRSFRNIPKNDRVYFRVTEPHKSGVPHLHISLFVPKDRVQKLIEDVDNLYPDKKYNQKTKQYDRLRFENNRKCKIVVNINNPVNYLMKYILKTIDDLRYTDKVTDLSLWYVYWGICRFYSSRTLISLDVYRALKGRFSLLELTQMYKEKELTVLLDTKTNKIFSIYDNFGQIYQKKHIEIVKDIITYDNSKPTLKFKLKQKSIPVDYYGEKYILRDNELIKFYDIKIPSKMKDFELYNYYKSLNPDDVELNYHHFGLVQNECVNRCLIDDIEYIPINNFNMDFDYEDEVPFY